MTSIPSWAHTRFIRGEQFRQLLRRLVVDLLIQEAESVDVGLGGPITGPPRERRAVEMQVEVGIEEGWRSELTVAALAFWHTGSPHL